VSSTGPDTARDLVGLASHPEGGDDPGLPAQRTPAVCNDYGSLKHENWVRSQ